MNGEKIKKPHKGSENLKRLTPEEARINGKKGGEKSGKVRSAQKDLKACLTIMIDHMTAKVANKAQKAALKLPNGDDKIEALQEVEVLKEVGILGYELMKIATDTSKNSSTKVRLAAIREIADRVEGKTIQRTEITGADGEAIDSNIIVNYVQSTAQDSESID